MQGHAAAFWPVFTSRVQLVQLLNDANQSVADAYCAWRAREREARPRFRHPVSLL
jgi:hypothetical protein